MPTINSHMATEAALDLPDPAIRRIGTDDLRWALAEGWQDFKAFRGDLIFVGLLYPIIALIAAAAVLDSPLLPLLFPMVAGLSIMGPAVASGFYELARQREAGEDAGWSHFFDPMKGRSREAFSMLTLLLAFIFLAWLVSAWVIYEATLGHLQLARPEEFLRAVFGTRAGWSMILLGNLVGAIFAILTLVTSIVSFPLVVDRAVDAGTALRTSVRAVRANPGMLARWGLIVAVLLFLGAIPTFIGLAVVLPVLGYATWHLYTRLVER